MKLIFEKSREGRRLSILPPADVPHTALPQELCREAPLRLPQVAECDIDRHYAALARRAHGVCNGFLSAGFVYDEIQPTHRRGNRRIAGFCGHTPASAPADCE